MGNRQGQLTAFLIQIGTVLIVFYVVFLLGKSIWTNYDLRESINKLNSQIATLEEQKRQLANLNLYYSSDSYKELEARRKLGLKKAGEKVVIIADTPGASANFADRLANDQASTANTVSAKQSPNWILWLDFFTKPTETH